MGWFGPRGWYRANGPGGLPPLADCHHWRTATTGGLPSPPLQGGANLSQLLGEMIVNGQRLTSMRSLSTVKMFRNAEPLTIAAVREGLRVYSSIVETATLPWTALDFPGVLSQDTGENGIRLRDASVVSRK